MQEIPGSLKHSDERIIQDLILFTRERAVANDTFTGAFVIRGNEIISKAVTSIVPDRNPLAHAEMKVLEDSNAMYNGDLSGCHLYTTQKPCMMCASAMVWSGISSVTYCWDTQSSEEGEYRSEIFLRKNGVFVYMVPFTKKLFGRSIVWPQSDEA